MVLTNKNDLVTCSSLLDSTNTINAMFQLAFCPHSLIRKELKDKLIAVFGLEELLKNDIAKQNVSHAFKLSNLLQLLYTYKNYQSNISAKSKYKRMEVNLQAKLAKESNLSKHFYEISNDIKQAHLNYTAYLLNAHAAVTKFIISDGSFSADYKLFLHGQLDKILEEAQKPRPDSRIIKTIHPAIQFGILGKIIDKDDKELEHHAAIEKHLNLKQREQMACIANSICQLNAGTNQEEKLEEQLQAELQKIKLQEAEKLIAAKVMAAKYCPKSMLDSNEPLLSDDQRAEQALKRIDQLQIKQEMAKAILESAKHTFSLQRALHNINKSLLAKREHTPPLAKSAHYFDFLS